jgi:opacity protein-like surface antigen
MSKSLIMLGVLLGLTATARAEEEKGLYIGAGIGQFNVQADDIDDIGPIVSEFDSDSTSFKIFGGWRFNHILGVELDYIDFGNPDDDVNGVKVETDLHGFAPYVTATLPVGPVELFGKVGYFFYDLDVDVAGQKLSSASGSQDDFVYGIGAGITLFDRLQARLEYELVDVSKTLDDADAVWVSALWRF